MWYNNGAKKYIKYQIKRSLMNSLNAFSLNCNKKFKINFNGGNLSSDAGLLLIKEFAAKLTTTTSSGGLYWPS